MTSADALKIVCLITAIAAVPIAIWAYKSAEDWLGAIARFVAVELIVFFAVLFVIAFFMGLATDNATNTDRRESEDRP